MKYSKRILAKDGREIELRSAAAADGCTVLDCFQQTHGETDFLLTYPEESRFDPEQEGRFLARKEESANEIELIALADGRVVGRPGSMRWGPDIRWRTGPSSASACGRHTGGLASAAA